MKDKINFDMDAAMQAELDSHLQSESGQNRKNGTSSKTIKTANGSFELGALAIVPEALSHSSLKAPNAFNG